jgi:hypothetical protein
MERRKWILEMDGALCSCAAAAKTRVSTGMTSLIGMLVAKAKQSKKQNRVQLFLAD